MRQRRRFSSTDHSVDTTPLASTITTARNNNNNNNSDMATPTTTSTTVHYRDICFGSYHQPVYEKHYDNDSVTHRSNNKVLRSLRRVFCNPKNYVWVQVHTVSVNPVDAKGVIGDKLPSSVEWLRQFCHNSLVRNTRVGFDFAGQVVNEPGSDDGDNNNNTKFPPGTLVFGTMPPLQGCFTTGIIQVPIHQIAKAPTITTTTTTTNIKTNNKSRSFSMEECAALPLTGLTAYQALHPYFNGNGNGNGSNDNISHSHNTTTTRANKNVLIIGGSGGTGHMAIQVAKALGATTIVAICGTTNVNFCYEMGATHVIDYRTTTTSSDNMIHELQQSLLRSSPSSTTTTTQPTSTSNATTLQTTTSTSDDEEEQQQNHRFHIILDCVTSGDPKDTTYEYPNRIRSPTAKLVSSNHIYQRLGGPWQDWIRAGLARPRIFPNRWLWRDIHEQLFWIQFPHSQSQLETLAQMVDNGQLRPKIQKVYNGLTADTVQRAMGDVLSRRVQGKVVIRVRDV